MSEITIATVTTSLLVVLGVSVLLNSITSKKEDLPVKLPVNVSKPLITFSSFYFKWKLFCTALLRFVTEPHSPKYDEGIKAQSALFNDPEFVLVKTKTIYFIRHGQSVWNASFSTFDNIFFVVLRIFRTILFEFFLLSTNDSLIYDSPLSLFGVSQCMDTAQLFSSVPPDSELENDISILTGKSTKSTVLFSSYLRRAQSTMILLLQSRLNSTNENIFISHELEELIRNPDTVTLYSSFGYITFPLMEKLFSPQSFNKYQRLKMVEHDSPSLRRAYPKVKSFFNRLFTKVDEDVIIVCGHSRWIRYTLNVFFPKSSIDRDYTDKKISNCGIIKFDVQFKKKETGEEFFVCDPKSLKIVNGGFA
ncbi:hypothetical protein BEWA_018500 [Theileria equi strain WA]|uniref:Uncharacterized protein n=1 Tax=Theileria equi strain WA TaxID=1537102 RepID=L0ATY5_THEEQ|nr:hypothetical protein BEWA_018500 [Theileria equi strain WA]AFZ79005.1 hypothetical protein BEWA_018500 [Theileria equi strain WA]|eukprot:XP_004828671.1 hypothetical protein BEWA_018500 [Theileria equi strain WA]